MNELLSLSKQDLLRRTLSLVAEERKITLSLIKHLREVERRMLFSELGYSSLWEFCVKHLGLSEGSSQRRISSMRLARDIPTVTQALESGNLNISTATQLQSFFQAERRNGKAHSNESKVAIVKAVEGLSKRDCAQKLAEISPEAVKKEEKVKPISSTHSELNIVLNSQTIKNLDRLKNLLGHRLSMASYAELIEYLTDRKLAELDRKKGSASLTRTLAPSISPPPAIVSPSLLTADVPKALHLKNPVTLTSIRNSSAVPSPSMNLSNERPNSRRGYISVSMRRDVWAKAKDRCEYVSPAGHRCNAVRLLELDHIQPLALGGRDDASNYRLLCKNHNLYQAAEKLGVSIMKSYIPSLRSSLHSEG